MPPLSRLSIGLRLSFWTTAVVFAVLSVLIGLAWRQSAATFEHQSRASLQTATAVMHRTLGLYHASLSDSVQRLTGSLAVQLPDGEPRIELRSEQNKEEQTLPVLRLGNQLLEADHQMVDRFTQASGAVATVFVRQNDQFVRVSTSLRDLQGQRVIGTHLPQDHPAHVRALRGESYTGPAELFGAQYMTHYRPLRDASGQTVAMLFVGLDYSEGLAALKQSLRQQRLGEDGHFFVVENANTDNPMLTVHPFREGEALSSLTSSGNADLLTRFMQQPGTTQLELHSGNDIPATQAIVSSIRFDPWDWTLVGVQPDTALRETQRTLLLMLSLLGLAALLLIALLIALASRQLVALPLRAAVEVAGNVARGQLDHPVATGQRGEIGELMQALASMRIDLLERQETERRSAAEILRVRLSLDSTASGTLVTDTELNIVYANPAFMALLQEHRSQLSLVLPAMCWDAPLEGQHLSALEPTGRMPDDLLDTLRVQRVVTSRRGIGPVSVERDLARVEDSDGALVGYVIQWRDRSIEARTEAALSTVVETASKGDLGSRLPTEGLSGFHLNLAQRLNHLLDTHADTLQQLGMVLDGIARGDLTVRMQGHHEGAFAKLRDDTNTTVSTLSEIVTHIQQASHLISTAAEEIDSGNTDLSQRTEQQAASLEETAASMEELTVTVRQNAENAQEANRLTNDATAIAQSGGQVISEVMTTMTCIEEASRQIGTIISVIDGIAFQTNILALNAAVEAARAGEEGRGFAVVAGEVRQLAQRSAAAAHEIKALVDNSVDKVAAGSALVSKAGSTMSAIVQSVEGVSALMSGISTASQEQRAGIEQINRTVVQLDGSTQQNAALVEEACASASSLVQQAHQLARISNRFRLLDATPSRPDERDFA